MAAVAVFLHLGFLVLAFRAVLRDLLPVVMGLIQVLPALFLPVFKGLVFLFVAHVVLAPFRS